MARVEKRGNSWRFTVSLGYDTAGKQFRKTKSILADGIGKTEAKQLVNEFELEVTKKNFTNDKNLTLSGFIDHWKEEYATKRDNYSPTMLQCMKNLFSWIVPELGHIRLSKLKPTHLM
jgi:hypothetical protein